MAKGSSGNSDSDGGFFGGYSGLGDMADGGGPGQSGDTFGGAFGGFSNAVGASPAGSGIAPSGIAGGIMGGYSGIGDMVDGGGPGRSGDTFGGFFGGQSNAIGATPYGSGIDPSGIAGNFMGGGSAAATNPAAMAMSMAGGPDDVRTKLLDLNLSSLTPAKTQAAAVSLTGDEASRRNAERSRVPTYEEGGMVGPGGKPVRPSTRAVELPPILQNLMGMPSYAEGGMVGPGGMPQRPTTAASPMAMNVAQQGGAPVVGLAQPGGQGRLLNFAAIDAEAQRFMQQNPQQVAQIKAEVQKAMAAGELDAASLNMFVQVATVALQNPSMWPQLRQTLIAQDMLDPEDISEEYDQGFLITLYIVGKTMGGGQAPAPMSAGQAPQMSMREGGPLPAKSENPDGSIPINAHEGEYVVPADVTRKLGTDHFDKLIAKARGADAKGEQQ